MDDLTTFLTSVESSARKILKQHNKKQQQRAINDRVALSKRAIKGAKPDKPSHRPTREELRVTYASDGALIYSAPASPTFRNQSSPKDLKNPRDEGDATSLPALPPPRSPVASAPLNTSLSSPSLLPAIAGNNKVRNNRQHKGASLKLLDSPLYKSLTSDVGGFNGTKSPGQALQKTLHAVDNVALLLRKIGLYDPNGAASRNHRPDHAVDKRMCHACWTTAAKPTGCDHSSRVYPKGQSVERIEGDAQAFVTRMELQGPTSWLSDDLFIKYRSEVEREKLWSAYLDLEKQQQATAADPILGHLPLVSRHPTVALVATLQNRENLNVQRATRKRNLTKAMVLDVNRIWLTNLDHFHPQSLDCNGLEVEQDALSGRRDNRAIREGYSQIQSISTERALKHVVTIGDGATRSLSPSQLLSAAHTKFQRRRMQSVVVYPLSLLCCGKWDPDSHPTALEQVPGVALVGKKSVLRWRNEREDQDVIDEESVLEYTKAVALFERKHKDKVFSPILVRLVLAFDAPILAPKCFAWHVGSTMPPPESEVALNTLQSDFNRLFSFGSPRLQTLQRILFESTLTDLMPSTIIVLNDQAQEEDQELESQSHRRGWSEFSTRHPFRQWLLLTDGRSVAPRYDVEMQTCTVTTAHPNAPGVCGRYCWHEVDPVVKLLSRRRVAKDLVYMLLNHKPNGSNDASYFTVFMKYDKMQDVSGARLARYLASAAEREARVAYEAKVKAIEQKLAVGRLAREAKRQEQIRVAQRLDAAAKADVPRNFRLKTVVEKVMAQAWARRLATSIVVKRVAGWERRESTVDGRKVGFYYSLDEERPVSRRFAWKQPKEWHNYTLDHQGYESFDVSQAGVTKIATGNQVSVERQDDLVRSLLADDSFLQQLKTKLGLHSSPIATARSTEDGSNKIDSDMKDEVEALVDDGMDETKASLVAAKMAKIQLPHANPTHSPPFNHVSHRADGWKRLKTSRLPRNFGRKVYKTHTEGPRSTFLNQTNHATPVGMLDPADCSVHELPQLVPELCVLFVACPADDLQEKKLLWKQSLRAQKPLETRNAERGAEFRLDDSLELASSRQFDTKEEQEAQALLCARNNNLAGLERTLDQGVDINLCDKHGNTLLILACQQGDKRLAKFLLRRRADINAQNVNGNTALHYLYAYNHGDLAEYLKTKGANDTTQNAAGLTCYEGLSQDDIDAI